MLQIESLDVLTAGEFVPYRDAQGRPRLLDVRSPTRASKPARKLYKRMLAVLAEGAKVQNSPGYAAWIRDHWAPLDRAIAEADLGSCIGDEGHTLRTLSDRVIDAVWRPGWRAE